MPPLYSSSLQHPGNARDSLELASLASSSPPGDDTATETDSRPSISSSRRASLERDDPLGDFDDDDNGAHAGYAEEGNGPGYGEGGTGGGGTGGGTGGGGGGARSSRPGYHGRSFSVSSTFDFAAHLFPLSSTTTAGYAPLGAPTSGGGAGGLLGGPGGGALEKHKTLTYLNGLSLIVGLIIGSGIFSSPSQVNANVGSPGAALVVWAVAGVLAWTGASSYAELGGAIPLNGGSQAYLAKILGELAGFLFAWVAVLVLKPGSAAIIAIIMAEYLVRAAIGPDAETVDPWVNRGVALAAVAAVTTLNCVSTRLGTRINDFLMFLKFVALLGVTVTGIVVAATGYSFEGGTASLDWKTHEWFEGTTVDASAWAVALYAGLWAYDGWDNTNYVVGEFRNPRRDLPRVIHTAMPLVITCYLLANVSYFLVLPLDAINSSNTVAVAFGAKVFGPTGALVLALIVSASCFGALNSSTFTSSRLVYVAGKEGYLPAVFGRIGFGAPQHATITLPSASSSSTTSGTRRRRSASWLARRAARLLGDEDTGLFFTPIAALLLNALLTTAYVLTGEFGTLVTFYGVAGYTFYFLTVLGLIVLRVREPALERPYRTWLLTPVVFCCVSLFLLSRAVFSQPLQTLLVVAFVVAGVPVYFWRVRRSRILPSGPAGGGTHGGGGGASRGANSATTTTTTVGAGAGASQRHKREVLGVDERAPWWKFWRWGRR